MQEEMVDDGNEEKSEDDNKKLVMFANFLVTGFQERIRLYISWFTYQGSWSCCAQQDQ